MPEFKLGRLHRTYDPRVPHLSALVAGQTLPPPPPEVDYTKGMPKNLGMMLNDTLGDCTCAAVYHAFQVWSFNASKGKSIDTEPDSDVEKLYVLACGYNPRVGGEGPGGNEQHVLTYLLDNGAPTGPSGKTVNKIFRVRGSRSEKYRRCQTDHQRLRLGLYRLQRTAIHCASECAATRDLGRRA